MCGDASVGCGVAAEVGKGACKCVCDKTGMIFTCRYARPVDRVHPTARMGRRGDCPWPSGKNKLTREIVSYTYLNIFVLRPALCGGASGLDALESFCCWRCVCVPPPEDGRLPDAARRVMRRAAGLCRLAPSCVCGVACTLRALRIAAVAAIYCQECECISLSPPPSLAVPQAPC